ncbi:hypothetical protein [Fimbriiglobus ruber]|uniref:hypothetical protein n=1 Tax=Fimbriiglobus ruber TaxID=1908690 RepID=UPI001379F335|nr:hypothetical protein [Fimbriiglobus ruber]
MGVEYRCFLIPRPNTFRPHPDAAFALVTALRDDGWLLGPEHPALALLPFKQSRLYPSARKHGYFALTVGRRDSFAAPLPEMFDEYADRDLMMVWPVESLATSGLRYPLDPLPFDDPADAADCYYEVQFHFGRDFIYHTSEGIDPFKPSPLCSRGHTVECEPESDNDPFYSARLAARCPQCGAAFDPTQLVATGRDGRTGAAMRVRGGATYRFAVVVDCGKFFGRRQLRFHPRLKSLVERTLGVETYEYAEFC